MKKLILLGLVLILLSFNVIATLDTYLTPNQYREISNNNNINCNFLNNLINHEYEIICVNELIGLCYPNENVMIIGDIKNTDIYFLTMFTYHEYGHIHYDMDEPDALAYGLEQTNKHLQLINLYRWANTKKNIPILNLVQENGVNK